MGTVVEGKPEDLTDETVMQAASDEVSRAVLAACIPEARPVKEISDAIDVPLATVYRRVDALQEDGLLVVERSALREDGSRYDLYRSRVEDILLRVSADGTSVAWSTLASVEDRIARMWEQMRL